MAIPIGTKCRVVVDYLMIDGSPMHSLPRGTEVVVKRYWEDGLDVSYPYYVHRVPDDGQLHLVGGQEIEPIVEEESPPIPVGTRCKVVTHALECDDPGYTIPFGTEVVVERYWGEELRRRPPTFPYTVHSVGEEGRWVWVSRDEIQPIEEEPNVE